MTGPKPRSELRKDYIQDKYVIIAPRRAARPQPPACPPPGPPAGKDCDFCPESGRQPEDIATVGPARAWRLKVKRNRYPAVTGDNPRAYGRQEVIIETPRHDQRLEELSLANIVELFDVFADRTRAISADPRIEYILIFKNTVGGAGASLGHSHCQIFATDFIPPHLLDKSEKILEYRLRCGRCPYCDVIARESAGPRLVWRDRQVVVFAPYASMYNYELWILPRRHFDNVTDMDQAEKKSWARALKAALAAVRRLGLPYNFYFHQVKHDTDQHLYMKITPRGSVWAGVEIGSGVIINPVAPEAAARYFRREFRAAGLTS